MNGTEGPETPDQEAPVESGSGTAPVSARTSRGGGGRRNVNVHRAIWVLLVVLIILIAVFVAVGGKLLGTSSSNGTSTPSSSGAVKGKMTVNTTHHGDTWTFRYIIHNTGNVPIAGFQLNGPKSNLYDVSTRRLWNSFGSGICQRRLAGILIYWSTGLSSSSVVQPGDSITLSFKTRTHGTVRDSFSLSWDGAKPLFGKVLAPAASNLHVTQVCPK
jgi:hypothetical protein